jgi:hypothetical protein
MTIASALSEIIIILITIASLFVRMGRIEQR